MAPDAPHPAEDSTMARQRPLIALAICILIAFMPAVIGAGFRPGPWYVALDKPSWTPPGWVFGPAWTALYLLSGLALWRLWRQAGPRSAPGAWALFFLALVCNAAWSPTFFGLHRIGLAMVVLICLWVVLAMTIAAIGRRTVSGAILLAPYLAWVTFAGTLNFGVWWLNR